MSNTPKETIEEKIKSIENSYIKLEKTGHIMVGAVSENVNWEEIKDLLIQTHNNALKLAVEKLKEIKSPMLGKDQHGTELYEAGTGQMQRNETIDQAIKNINSLVI